MIKIISQRFFNTCQAYYSTGTSSVLGKLRKSTGYSVANCKKALDRFSGDIIKAEEWLHAEAKQQGWTKWAKVQTRSATQGVVGVFSDNKLGVMVEVNCETDFVAKNADFHLFIEKVIAGCVDHLKKQPKDMDITKITLNEMELNQLSFESSSLSDLVNSTILKFNEKTVLKRAIGIKVKEDLHLCSLAHPGAPCPNLSGAMIGKYGTLLAVQSETGDHRDVSLDVCQHIIGMNPSTLGELTEKDILAFSQRDSEAEIVEDVREEKESEIPDDHKADPESKQSEIPEEDDHKADLGSSKEAETEETRLLFQPYLLDPAVSVGHALHNAQLRVLDFVRFECGEEQHEEEAKIKQSATA